MCIKNTVLWEQFYFKRRLPYLKIYMVLSTVLSYTVSVPVYIQAFQMVTWKKTWYHKRQLVT